MRRTCYLGLAALLMLGAGGAATEADPGKEPTRKPTREAEGGEPRDIRTTQAGPIYKLPSVGKPRKRVGGGRRGPASEQPEVFLLVPDHVGLSIEEQPTLYWYLSDGGKGQVAFELTMIDEDSIQPVVDTHLDRPLQPGLQKIALADHGVSLEPGQEYQWSVALVVDPDNHSLDVVSTGWIERVAAPAGLEAALASTAREQHASVYGEAGIWYDLLASLCERLPEESARAELKMLLAQVELPPQAAR